MQIKSTKWVKSTLISMEISVSIMNPPVLIGYRISTNHPVIFKITFKINFHSIPPNSKSYSLNIIRFTFYIKFFKQYKYFKLHLNINIDFNM